MRRLVLVMTAALAVLAGLFVAAPASNAANVTFVEGLTKGKFGAYQVFDVARTPALPTCSGSRPDLFTMKVQDAVWNPDGLPYSGAARTAVELKFGYVMFFKTSDPQYPWGIRYYNRLDQELRWSGTEWLKPDDAGWGSAKPFSEGGNIVAVNQDGFLHISKETGTNWDGGYGTYISITEQRAPGDIVDYTPDADMNTCKDFVTPNFNGTATTARGPVVNLSTTKTILVPDHPLGPATAGAGLKAIKVNAGELEGQIKPGVFEYNWGVATTGTDSLQFRIFPSNAAALIEYQGNMYRSGQMFTNISVTPGNPRHIQFTIHSSDDSKTQEYVIHLTAYPTNVKPEIRKLSEASTANTGGMRLKITGVGFTYAKGVVFSPNTNIYSARAVTVTKTPDNVKKGLFKVLNDREMEVVVPAVPNPDGGYYTGAYNVMIDTPFYNSGYSENATILFKEPQKPVTVLDWAKTLITPGLTKLLSLPVKLNTGNLPKFSVKAGWLKLRAKPAGDNVPFTVIQKSDGLYIDILTTRPVEVAVTVTADGTKKYAPFYLEQTITS